MLIKVVTLSSSQSLLAAADFARKVADADDDLSLEMLGFDVDRARDVVVDWDDGELVPRWTAGYSESRHAGTAWECQR